MAELTTPYIETVRRGVTIDSEHKFERQLEDGTWEIVNMTGKVVAFYLEKAKLVGGTRVDFVLKSGQAPTANGSKIELINDGDGWRRLITDDETLSMENIENIRAGFVQENADGSVDFIDSFKARIIGRVG